MKLTIVDDDIYIYIYIYVLHYLKDPKLWELYGIFLFLGNALFISSTL